MGNCQAIDNASLVIQHQNGRAERLYSPVTASEIMKLNPGHYVALLLTTTLYPSTTVAAASTATKQDNTTINNHPVRITRIKLLRPTDSLTLGHSYRLITTQEVMKGLWAKKYGKMKKKESESAEHMKGKRGSDCRTAATRSEFEKINQEKKPEKHQSRTTTTGGTGNSSAAAAAAAAAAAKSRAWHPSLKSISEAAS